MDEEKRGRLEAMIGGEIASLNINYLIGYQQGLEWLIEQSKEGLRAFNSLHGDRIAQYENDQDREIDGE